MLQPFIDAWRHRELFRAVLTRELQVRFRGSIFGWLWAMLAPIVMLTLYTLVFSGALKVEAAQSGAGRFDYAFSIFVGLIVFNLFAEIAYRAPMLLAEHKHIIRRSIFPPQILAWIAVARALVYALIALAILLAGPILINHTIFAAWLTLPFILIPLCLTLLGHRLDPLDDRRADERPQPPHHLDHPGGDVRHAGVLRGVERAGGLASDPVHQSAHGLHRDDARHHPEGRACRRSAPMSRASRGRS